MSLTPTPLTSAAGPTAVLRQAVLEAAASFVLALLLLGPIVGLVLDGY